MNTATTYRPCWNCDQPATHTLTREGSNTLHACDNCTRIDCAEDERLGWTISKKATVMTENQEPTMTEATTPPSDFEPVAFQDVHEGDTLSFARRDNGFGGSGDILRLTGTVTKATDKTVTVEITGHNPFAEDVFVGGKSRRLGRTASLRRANWNERDVHRTAKATRRPYNAENVQYVDEGNIVTAVWCSDPTISPEVALENVLLSITEQVPYEVETIADATRFRRTEGASFSRWIISRGNDYSTEPIKRKRDAVKELHGWVEGYFTR